jgi:CubicO group peptidase (beta-lactamase class C family)
MKIPVLYTSILLLFLCRLSAQNINTLSNLQIQKLDSLALQDVPPKAPGIATAIIKNGKVIYQKIGGYADLKDSLLINGSTRFNIASNGKQFTALAILSLINQKKLKLTDDIRIWFPTLYPNVKEKINISSLLSHSSGIRDCYDLWSLQGFTWWQKSFDNNDVLALINNQTDLSFSPNSKYLYSNTNYILLALIIEKVSGQSFVKFTKSMFQKLNMPNTAFETDFTKIIGPIAKAYFNFGTWTTYDWTWNVCGDGNLFSTLNDQIQWETLVQGRGKTTFNRRLIAQSQQLIKKSDILNYGYGLEFGKYKGLNYCFHEGATGALKATVLRFSDKKTSMFTLTNTGKSVPSSQTRQMADLIFDLEPNLKYWATQPAGEGAYITDEQVLGTYLTKDDFSFTFIKKENKIFLQRVGRNDVELEREANNIFHQKYDSAFKQEFTQNLNGVFQVTAYYTEHAPYDLQKVSNPQGIAQSYLGDYYNVETNTSISIKHLEGPNFEIIFRNDYKTNGLLVSDHKMLVDYFNFEFFENGLFLNGERIKKVRYLKRLD